VRGGGGGTAAKTLFALTIENLTIIPDEVDLRGPLIEALTEPWGRPSDLLGVAKAVLRATSRRSSSRTRYSSAGVTASSPSPGGS